jgi:hypothetical protein
MADGNYLFENCIAQGTITFIDVSPNTVINRPWSFRVNDPPKLISTHQSRPAGPNTIDPARVARGYDGTLWDQNRGLWLANVHTFRMEMESQVDDLPLAGQRWVPGITQGLTGMISFEEYAVSDDLLELFMAGVAPGSNETLFAFMGKLRGR